MLSYLLMMYGGGEGREVVMLETEKHYRGKIKDKMSQELKRLLLAWSDKSIQVLYKGCKFSLS